MASEYRMLKFNITLLDRCVDLFIETFSGEPWNDVYNSREQVVEFFKNYMKDSFFLGYVTMLNENVVALCIGSKKPWIQGMEFYIDQFCVDQKQQGKGLGSQFLAYIQKEIKSEGLNAMTLTTGRGFPAENFYLKNGFQKSDHLICLNKCL